MPSIPKEQRAPWPDHGGAQRQRRRTPTHTPTVHRGQGDRGDNDDNSDDDAAAAPRLPVYVRYRDLVAAGIIANWETLGRAISKYDFPPGVLLSGNRRAWRLDEVLTWLDGRPVAHKTNLPKRKYYKKRTEQAQAADPNSTTT